MNGMSLERAFAIAGRSDLLAKTASAESEDYSFLDKNATFRSFVVAHVKQANSAVIHACEQHADFWGIREDCDRAVKKIAEWQPPTIADGDYALVQDHESGPVRKYAAFDAQSTVDSAIAFIDNRARYPMAWRKQAAAKLLSRAERFEANLPEYVAQGLHKSAQLGFPTPDAVQDALVCRANHVTPEHEEIAAKLAYVLDHITDDQQLATDEEFVKCAMATMEDFDAHVGLTHRYGDDVTLPEEILGATTHDLEKVACLSKLAVELVNGKTVDVSELTKEALEAVDPALAKMAQDELVDVLPTLPKGDADLLMRLQNG